MAWNAEFMDTFAHYPIAQATQLGKWTGSLLTPGSIPITEDTYGPGGNGIGLNGGTLSKTLTGPAGRIIATRGYTTGNGLTETIFCCQNDAADHRISLTVAEGFPQRVTLRYNATSVTSAQVSIPNGEMHNYELAFLFNGAALVYAVYVDGVKLDDIGPSFATAATPGMTGLLLYNPLGTVAGLYARSWVATKAYTGSGGVWSANDLYGNVKRGLLYPEADGVCPAGSPGRNWRTDIGTGTFTARVGEITGDSGTSFILNDVDGHSAPVDVDLATWILEDAPSDVPITGLVTDIPHVQISNLAIYSGVLGEVQWIIREDTQSDSSIYYHTDALTIGPAWHYYLQNFGRDPRGGDIWTRTLLNTMELGVACYSVT